MFYIFSAVTFMRLSDISDVCLLAFGRLYFYPLYICTEVLTPEFPSTYIDRHLIGMANLHFIRAYMI